MRIGTMFGRFNLREGHRFRMGRDPFGDKDKDGAMNIVDCKPNDPRKQGFLGEVIRKRMERMSKSYKEYREQRPRIEQERIESLKRQAEMERQKTAIVKTQAERRRYAASGFNKGIEAGAFGLGRAGLMPGLSSGYAKVPKPIVRHKHHRHHKKHKVGSKGARYTIVGGKAYPIR